ncbi:MAG: N-acetyltransferase [Gemmatimonadota bacterium]|nr:N-acetyltransferase [Gemmatimonadota bacterium]
MIEIERVEGWRGISRFIEVAWTVQAGRDTPWVPPLRAAVRDLLNRKKNPFYDNADRALFIAHRDGAPVGRIAAIENRRHNAHHGDRVGFFGFFECGEDQDAADALLRAAEEWLSERGCDRVRGPMNPSMNHECGLLVDGFEHRPVIMTPWNPPYYMTLLDSAGYDAVRDLLGYWVPARDRLAVPERVARLAERARRKSGVTFRELDVTKLKQEARNVLELYVEAWDGNWGFVPPTWEEFWHTARDLEAVLADGFSFVAEANGETVGFMMIAHDVNEVLREMPSGRLWPWNIVRLSRGIPRVLRGRVVLLGLRSEFRNLGLFPLFAHEAARRALDLGAEGAEASWVLADNHSLVDPLDAMGLEPYRRWRIYERPIPTSS